jgi:CHRD domain
MRRLLVLAVLAGIAVIPFTQASASTKSAGATLRPICRATASASRPYVKVRVNAVQYRAALRRAANIIPAPAVCPRTRLTPTAGGTALTTNLAGEAESPAGDPVGTGTATVRLRKGQGQVCYSIDADNITLPAAGAHIHSGAAGASGPIVVQFTAPGESGSSSGCAVAARSLVAQILGNSAGYYVNVHTTDYPAGAIRGQLGGTPPVLGRTVTVQMSGAQECNVTGTCGVGDTDGTGTSIIRFRPEDGQVCFKLSVQNIRLPSVGAHIHQAARGVNGPILVQFVAPDANGKASGCTLTPRATIDAITGNLAGYYSNAHTTDFPAGAIRGQLG